MKKALFILLILLIGCFTKVEGQSVKSGLKAIEKEDFEKAQSVFSKILEKEAQNPLANFGMALLYHRPQYDFYNLYSAYNYIEIASENWALLKPKEQQSYSLENEQKQISQDLLNYIQESLDSVLIEQFMQEYPESDIYAPIEQLKFQLEYEKIMKKNTLEAYQHFIREYPNAPQISEAKTQRNTFAYQYAQKQNTINAYDQFIQSYPEASQIELAQNKRDSLAFSKATQQHTIQAYESFIQKYPNAREVQQAQASIDDLKTFDKTYILGQFDPTTHPDFVLLDNKYCLIQPQYMHREAYEAFQRMWEAAKADGINLSIRSAARNFYTQKFIWESKWQNLSGDAIEKAKTILKFSSMPGTSRHHWGTDIDLNSLSPSYFTYGQGKKEYDWLVAHAEEFGFFQPYTALGFKRYTGYLEEKWHWSYRPIAEKCLKAYNALVHYSDIAGYIGSDMAQTLDVIKNYVQGIAE